MPFTSSNPTQIIPDDVLQDIFLLCLPKRSYHSLTPSRCPVLLTHICHRWRNVALAFPLLWKSLRCDTLRIYFAETNVHLLTAALARTGDCPHALQLIVRTRSWFDDHAGADVRHPVPCTTGMFTAPHAASLTRLNLRGIPIAHIHPIPRGIFPSLIDLVLELHGFDLDTFPWPSSGPIQAFAHAPALRRVSLNRHASFGRPIEPRRYVASHVSLPWTQLTYTIEGNAPTGPSCLFPHLRGCGDLRYLSATMDDADIGVRGVETWGTAGAGDGTGMGTVTGASTGMGTAITKLDALESLTLYFWACRGRKGGEIGYPAFFDLFAVPNLRALRLDGSDLDFDLDPVSDFNVNAAPNLNMMNNSNANTTPPNLNTPRTKTLWTPTLTSRFLTTLASLPHLTHLALILTAAPPSTLRRVFRATPCVTTLDASLYNDYQGFFEVVTWGGGAVTPGGDTATDDGMDGDAGTMWDSDEDERQCLLPMLDTLILDLDQTESMVEGDPNYVLNPNAFRAFLESRLRLDVDVTANSSPHSSPHSHSNPRSNPNSNGRNHTSTSSAPRCTPLRNLIAHCTSPAMFERDVPFVGVVAEFVGRGGLEVEVRGVRGCGGVADLGRKEIGTGEGGKEEEGENDDGEKEAYHSWKHRDAWLEDWLEAVEVR